MRLLSKEQNKTMAHPAARIGRFSKVRRAGKLPDVVDL